MGVQIRAKPTHHTSKVCFQVGLPCDLHVILSPSSLTAMSGFKILTQQQAKC